MRVGRQCIVEAARHAPSQQLGAERQQNDAEQPRRRDGAVAQQIRVLRDLLSPGRKPGGRNSGLLSCEALQARADKAWMKAGLRRITLHECRHTAISWLDGAGVRHQVISTIAGHELKHGGAQVTARYTHTLPGDIEYARILLEKYLADQCPNSSNR